MIRNIVTMKFCYLNNRMYETHKKPIGNEITAYNFVSAVFHLFTYLNDDSTYTH